MSVEDLVAAGAFALTNIGGFLIPAASAVDAAREVALAPS